MWPFDNLPAVPGAPGMPSPGGFPGLPGSGGMPGLPGGMPGLPSLGSMPGIPSPGSMPGLPTPGAWPTGVPNPFGLPSPGDMASTIGGLFSNPYGTTGTQGNENPWGGINPFDTRFSGGKWNSGGSMPTYGGDTSMQQSQTGFAPLSQLGQRPGGPVDSRTLQPNVRPPPNLQGPTRPPPQLQDPMTGGHMGGSTWGSGILGPQWLYHQGSQGPWQHVQPGSSMYGKGGG